MTAIAVKHGVPIWDMNAGNPAITRPLSGSDAYFIDHSHYSAKHGAAILSAMGFQVEQSVLRDVERMGLGAIGSRIAR